LNILTARFTRSPETLYEDISNAIAARKDLPAKVLVVTNEPTAAVADSLSPHNLAERTVTVPWSEFVAPVLFTPKDPANLALRPFKWQLRHTLSVLTAVFALAAIALTINYTQRHLEAAHLARSMEDNKAELKSDVAGLQDAAARYRQAETIVQTVPLDNPRPSALLDAVTSALPTTLTLRSFIYQSGNFTLDGIAFEGIGQEKGPIQTFADALVQGERTWSLRSTKPQLNGVAWSLSGSFVAPKSTQKN
jgi:hypothetical protein